MLKSLKVKNYALINDLEINFDTGISVVTGETGAGKSIILGALGISLGQRVDTSVIQEKETKCIVESTFDLSAYGLKPIFDDADLDYESISIFRREIKPDGKSRAFVNDTPVKASILQEIASHIIEIHSQHDNLSLFKTNFQFEMLDALCETEKEMHHFVKSYKDLQSKKKDLEYLKKQQFELQQAYDFNSFLLQELQELRLENIDEQTINEQLELLNNATLLNEVSNKIQFILEGEGGVIDKLIEINRSLEMLPATISKNILSQTKNILDETQDTLRNVATLDRDLEIAPEDIQGLNELSVKLSQLKMKHRVDSVSELIEIQQELQKKVDDSDNLSNTIQKLEQEIDMCETESWQLASQLSQNRLDKKEAIERRLNDYLIHLGMEHSRILFKLEDNSALTLYGSQNLTVCLSSDGGKTYNDLKKSASGGELSRINLSIKAELSEKRGLPTSIFDEIDTGVSGEIARKVGLVMKKMSKKNQIITITHLPQIASLGKTHYFVYKNNEQNKISTSIKKLSENERISEIAKMISGDKMTSFALEQSKALIQSDK